MISSRRLADRLLACAVAAGVAGVAAAATPVASVREGTVTGTVDGDVERFLGVPYAAPPIGPDRWRPPRPAAKRAAILAAENQPAACIQAPPAGPTPAPATSEDCLYLNLWRPAATTPGARLPVFVWIHGGAFRAGSISDPRIQGDLLARRGIIVVTIQYRLGVLGFLSHPGLSAESADHVSGNYGLLDQIAALKWVRQNIAAFGGDPAKVTIGGLSAGAISTAMLASAPQARGLYRGIVSMSGGSFAPPRSPSEAGENMEPLRESEKNGARFAEGLGARDIAALRAVPAATLATADTRGVGWPVIDGLVIPGDEYRLWQERKIADVPLLLGTTADEGFSFSRIGTLDQYRAEVARRYGSFAPDILRAYPAATDAEAVRQGRDLTRDVMFGWGTWIWGTLQARYGKAPVHSYYFAHVPPRDARTPPDAGAVHGGDQPYPFGIAHQDRAWTDSDRRISDAMLRYFANFVKTGDPNGNGLPAWPRLAAEGQQVLRIDDDLAAGPVANRAGIETIDRYMALRREQSGLGAPK
ncbi:carboxylesterase family protein [Sphingomonas sp.]|uniref:carboxylesterase/lipase family protein n=1 Tax=Sphingomonas sp. TaxID=28214 RepID=UPI0025D6E65E|nr:carboxylesterase family protein [Sphingomonas sp.]